MWTACWISWRCLPTVPGCQSESSPPSDKWNFWHQLAREIVETNRAVDFIAIDGGEGGTGAAPPVFADHVALPFTAAFAQVHRVFYEAGLHEKIVFVGAGKLGFPESALFAFALGCDMIAVGREAMMAVGCIQAQECHTGHCPTGVATQRKRLVRGLKPGIKSHHFANYVLTLRKEILQLSRACGVVHPALITTDHFDLLNPSGHSRSAVEHLDLSPDSRTPNAQDLEAISPHHANRPWVRIGRFNVASKCWRLTGQAPVSPASFL